MCQILRLRPYSILCQINILTQEYEGTNEDFHNNSLQIYRTVLGKFLLLDYTYKDWGKNSLQVFTFWLSLEKPLSVLKEYT
jgi:hypothetical protein